MSSVFKVLLVTASMSFVFCENRSAQNLKSKENISSVTDNCDIKQKFKDYRISLKQKDVAKINNTINIANPSDVWRVVFFNKDEEILDEKLLERPLNESAIGENFDMIFSKEFMACFEKLNIDELISKGQTVTTNHAINTSGDLCRIISTFDNPKKELVMVLLYEFYDNGNKYESSVNYSYSLNNCTVKMFKVLLVN